MNCRRPMLVFLTLAATLPAAGVEPQSSFALDLKVDELTMALVDGRPLDIYGLFVPAFQAEVPYPRFESTFIRWLGGRRLVKARSKVVGINGPGGHVSTFIVFEGEDDYRYVYQAWLNANGNWRIAWLSGILDPGFQYGFRDTGQLGAVASAALRYALSPDAPRRFRQGLAVPDTVVMLVDSVPLALTDIDGRPVVHVTRAELAAGRAPAVPYVCAIPLVRVYGDLALVAVDVRPGPASAAQRLARHRGLEVYFARSDSGWRFHSLGRVF